MARFRVGEKVLIRNDIEIKDYQETCNLTEDMYDLKGEEAIITEVFKAKNGKDRYRLDKMGVNHCWCDEMLESPQFLKNIIKEVKDKR